MPASAVYRLQRNKKQGATVKPAKKSTKVKSQKNAKAGKGESYMSEAKNYMAQMDRKTMSGYTGSPVVIRNKK